MTAVHLPEPSNAAGGAGKDRSRSRIVRWVLLSVLALVVVLVVFGGVTLFAWAIDDTRFDRPSEEFGALAAQIEDLPGVTAVESDRWAEAPFIGATSSSIAVTVDEEGLPGVLEAACSTDYPGNVQWSLRVRTAAATLVTVHEPSDEPEDAAGGSPCPGFGFDAVGLVHEIDTVVPGLAIQTTIWEDGRLTLVALGEESSVSEASMASLLPLVAHSGELLAAAGRHATESLEINASTLGVIIEPGEEADYVALLTRLAEDHDVGNFWADGGGTPEGGIERVQIVAPEDQRTMIEQLVRASGLHISEFPIRFI
jgi:hypothetical protein